MAFLDGSKSDPLTLPLNNVVPILINIEEEKTLRPPNRYEGVIIDGIQSKIHPPLNLNVSVLFVSRFADYQQALKFLSLTIRFFQRNPIFDHFNTPTLNPDIERLRIELATLAMPQQHELWSLLRTTYMPSVLYKLGILVFEDNEALEVVSETNSIGVTFSNTLA